MRERGEGGFTVIEVLVTLAILAIGMAGLLKLTSVSFASSAVSRHMTEASVLGEDKLEALRTIAGASLASGSDTVKDVGRAGTGSGNTTYTRTWTVTPAANGTYQIAITVSWNEMGSDAYAVTLNTTRGS